MPSTATSYTICLVLPLLLSLASPSTTYGQSSDHPASHLPIPRSHLTDSEIQQAAKLGAEGALDTLVPRPVAAMSTRNITVLSSIESVDDNTPGSRLALVTSYSYDRNVTIRRLVDLTRNVIVQEQVTDDSSAPLAELEKNAIEHFVRTDDRIANLLGEVKEQVTVEMLLTRTRDRDDRFFGKRVVSVLLKTPQGYLVNLPNIYVNLSNVEVVLQEKRK